MDKINEALQRIYEALDSVGEIKTSVYDWELIIEYCQGADYIDTIRNLQDFITEKFSFAIEEGAEGFVYYGNFDSNNKIGIFQVINAYSEQCPQYYGYISSTQAGKLFNDRGFNKALEDWAKNIYFKDKIKGFADENAFYKSFFDGTKTSGYIKEIIKSADSKTTEKTVRAFNDFFSENYVNNLKCSNVDTIFLGGIEKEKGINCFGRTEFKRILDNNNIFSINGVDKQIYNDIYEEASKIFSEKKSMEIVCEAIKSSELKNIENVYFVFGDKGITLVSKETIGSLPITDLAIMNGKISPTELNDFYKRYGDHLPEYSKAILKNNIQAYNKEFIDICFNDGEDILRLSGKDEIDFGVCKLCSDGSLCDSNGVVTARKTPDEPDGVKWSSTGKTLMIVLNGISIGIEVYNTVETYKDVAELYRAGNYRSGCKEVISYVTECLAMLAGNATMDLLFWAAAGSFSPIGFAALFVMGLIMDEMCQGISEVAGDILGDWICDLLGYTDADYDAAGTAVRHVADPLVIDLDGDGFELLSLANGVFFNENAEGLIEKTQWVTPDDALLAIDLNGDGIINDGSELFGTSTTLADGSKARSGFEALAQYDENGDGIIDENDAAYSQLLIWRDMNSDGVSQTEELVSLQEVGIQSISLSHYDEDGRQVAGITFNDGRENKIGEFNFEAQLYNTKELEEIEISEEIRELANVRAIGNVASLHTMMQADESGILKGYVEAFSLAETTAEKEELLTKILYRITGAENVKSNSRGGLFDAQKLTVIEAFMGRNFVGTAGSNPVNTAATILGGMYSDIYEIYYNLMNAETALKDYLGMTFWIKDENENRYLDTSFFYAYVDYCRKEGNDMTSVVADMGRYIAAINATNKGNFVDYVSLYEDNMEYLEAIKNCCLNNVLIGIDKGETLKAGIRDTYLIGVGGDNSLYGGNGDDYLRGSKGDDYLEGGAGRDTYRFDLGWGNDKINNYDTGNGRIYDRIEFGEGIRGEDLRLVRSGSDLLITNTVSGDQITVYYAYGYTDGRYFLEKIRFSDGTEWGLEEISEKVSEAVGTGSDGDDTMFGYNSSYGYSSDETFHGGAGNDIIKGNGGNDIIYGDEGNDSLDGGSGDDYLEGGTGDDYLEGGYGDDYLEGGSGDDYLRGGDGKDTYRFDLGWGNDRIINYDTGNGRIYDCIEFGEGIRGEDLRLVRSGNSLVITHMVSGDRISVDSAYQRSDGWYFLEKIRFSDGTEWGLEEISEKVSEAVGTGSDGDDKLSGYNSSYGYSSDETFHGGAGNDTINGNGGNDIIHGDEGNDSLDGGSGDDYLEGGSGDDYLSGGDGKDTYHFDLSWGNDRINNYDTGSGRIYDCIEFGEGIRGEDLHLVRSGNSLVITHMVSGDRISVDSAYQRSDGWYFLEKIRFSDGTEWGLEEISEKVSEAVGTGSDGDDTMFGYNSSYGYSSDETFHGGEGNDTINGNRGNDILYGEEGNDSLDGGYGDDYLEGGSGDDYLSGEDGKDTYHFDLGWGNDRINNYDTGSGRIYDCIEFGEGIRGEDLRLVRSGNSLVITHMVSGDRISVDSAYQHSDGWYFLEKIRFSDGTEWGLEEISEKVSEAVGTGSDGDDTMFGYNSSYGYSSDETFHGGAGNDIIKGNGGNDIIYGDEGNDSLDGGSGDDYLEGGTGDDYLEGGYGDDYLEGGSGDDYLRGGDGKDTYHFDLGWGNDRINNYDTGSGRIYDRIEFGEGIRGENLRLVRSGNNLVITHMVSGDRISVDSAYQHSDGWYFLEKIRFADGTEWGLEEIAEKVAETVGTGSDGDDTMSGYNSSYGYSSDEIFHGGAGNDTINGNSGNDILYGDEGNDKLYGGYGDDYLEGGNGDDYLEGGYGDDYLEGGSGDDYLRGGDGKDTYHFDLGWGMDTIFNYDLSSDRLYDRIVFGMGIYVNDLALERKSNNLVITSTTSGDTITICNAYYYSDERCQIGNVTFSDGTKGIIDYNHTEIVLEEPEVLDETEDNVSTNDENNTDESATSAEIITDITDTKDIDSSTDTSAALLTEVLDTEMTENEDIVHTEESVLSDIMAEDNSSNMDESTDLQAMLMVQELSGTEDNNICSNDMENNIYEMPLFTEQFAVAE